MKDAKLVQAATPLSVVEPFLAQNLVTPAPSYTMFSLRSFAVGAVHGGGIEDVGISRHVQEIMDRGLAKALDAESQTQLHFFPGLWLQDTVRMCITVSLSKGL